MSAWSEFLEVPEVTRTNEGTIRVTMTPEDAKILGKVLAHYGSLVTMGPTNLTRQIAIDKSLDHELPVLRPPSTYVADVWQHTMLALFAESIRSRGRYAEPAAVDITSTPSLRSVGGDQR